MKNTILSVVLTAAVLVLTGCSDPLDRYDPTFQRYNFTELKVNSSADVLSWIQDPNELLSQSESVVVSWGQGGPKDRTHYFNMVAFDEEELYAVRKYGFIHEETHWGWNRTPDPALRFDAELVMDAEVLEAPYANNNEKYIEILKAVREQFQLDAQEIVHDSDVFRNSTMMVNRALNRILYELDHTPAYAVYLPQLRGMGFDHPILGKSRVRMLIEDDRVKIKIKCGKNWFKKYGVKDYPFEKHPDVINM